MKAALYVVGGLAVVLFFVVRQRRSDRFQEPSLLFPVGLGIYGVFVLDGTLRHEPLTAALALLLSLSAVASIGFGVFRGRTIELSVLDGELWERATWTTIAGGWGGLLLTRVALIAVAAAVGAKLAASPSCIPALLALTLATQTLVVSQRAHDTGATITPSRSSQRRMRRSR